MKKLFITVKPNAKKNSVEQIDGTHFRIRVKAPPAEGRANEAVIEVLADYLHVPKIKLSVVSGHKSKNKVVGVEE